MNAPSNDLNDLHSDIGNLAHMLAVLYGHTTEQEFERNGVRNVLADQITALAMIARDLAENLDRAMDACHDKVRADARKAKAAAAAVGPISEPGKLSMNGLFDLFDAFGTLHEIMNGLLSQPRFQGGEHVLNPAGEALEDFAAIIAKARDTIRDEAVARKATVTDKDAARLVYFLAEEWVDGSCTPEAALKGLTKALAGLGKAVSK